VNLADFEPFIRCQLETQEFLPNGVTLVLAWQQLA
jgi:hypothetical protein